MRHSDRMRTYNWLITLLRCHPYGLTRKEINDLWIKTDLSGGVELSESSFKRYKDACYDICNIIIECDKHYRYYIANKPQSEQDSVWDFMMRSLAVGKVLSESQRIHKRILIEEMPSGKFIDLIISAMNRNMRIELTYLEYGSKDAELIVAEPYVLKTYHHRWYLLGRLLNGEMRVISLDRVDKVAQTSDKFIFDESFDVADYFSEFYAVRLDSDVPVQRVILRAHENERFILERQHIHPSQKIRSKGDNYYDFEYWIRPTFDFVSYLESQGRFIEVLEPLELRKELLRVHREAMERNKI